MRILHLTDFHYKNDITSVPLQEKLVRSLCNSLKKIGEIDLFFFTGDLVFQGNEERDFDNAYEQLIKKVLDEKKLNEDQLILCAGNHDVHRYQEMKAIGTHFETKIKSNEELNDFIKVETDPQYRESCKNINNYLNFLHRKFSSQTATLSDKIHPLYSIHKRTIDSKKIGIATINSAWRAINDESKGKLLYPVALLQNTINEIKDTELKILLMHHGLDEFIDFNVRELENEIYQGFLLMFSGHLHKRKQHLQITTDEGILCCTSPASLSLIKGEKIGYTILNVNPDSYEVAIENVIYDMQDDVFVAEPKQIIQIPLSEVKKEKNDFRRTLRKRYEKEIENANDLFVENYQYDNSKIFLDLFTPPVLKTKSKSEIKDPTKIDLNFNFEDLFNTNQNYLIFGKAKSGKSSLLKRIQLEWLDKFSYYKIISFYVDFKAFKIKKIPLRLINNFASYYEMSQANMIEKINQYVTVLLIDDFDPEQKELIQELVTFIKENKNSFLIATTEEFVYRTFEPIHLDNIKFYKVFLHEITRKDLRILTSKWPSLPAEKKDDAIKQITQIFDQLHIPYNYWSVSLFLWIFEKFNDPGIHSNISLIELYIEGLLERKKLIIERSSKISYENLKSYLGELSHYLVTDFYENIYSASYADLVNFTEKFKKENKRFVVETEFIVNGIIDRGIIKKRDDERYTFRLRGVFEYFLAYYMFENKKFRNEILSDNTRFLSYSNEFSLYAGMEKKDEDFLNELFKKTQFVLHETNAKYSIEGTIDKNLISRLEQAYDILSYLKKIPEEKHIALNLESQDEVMDEIKPINNYSEEVKQKKKYDERIIVNAEILEQYLSLICKVYRNSYLVKNNVLTSQVFDFILNSACNFGFYILDNFEDMELPIDIDKEDKKFIIQLFAHVMPLVVQGFLSESLSQNNLERVYIEKIEELKINAKENQFKLFLLYNLLIDLDVKTNFKLIDELIEIVTIGILKTSILGKLHYYLRFKAYINPKLEEYLKQKIKEYAKEINEKVDQKFMDKKLTDEHKKILIKKYKQ
jgi:predicted MPP superfamily phosphohydrolase